MTLPTFIFGSFLALLTGSLFHLIFGGDLKKLLLYLVLGWLGFWVGNYLSRIMGWNLIKIGPLDLGISEIGSLLFLSIGFWLSMENQPKKSN